MRRAVWSSLAIVVGSTCAGCGARLTGDVVDATADVADSAEPAWTREDFRKAYVSAHCDHLERCCLESERPYDDAACRARFNAAVDAFPDGPNVTIDTAMAKACVADWSRTTDHCGWYRDVWIGRHADIFDACSGVFHDDGAQPGEPCPGGICAASPLGSARCEDIRGPGEEPNLRCLVFVSAKLGEPCGRTDAIIRRCDLAAGIRCDPVSNVCQPLVPTGGACQPIAGVEVCNDDATCSATKTCVPRIPLGGTCDTPETTSVLGCVAGAQCDTDAQRCVAPLPLLAPCTDDFQCESFVCAPDGATRRCLHLLATLPDWCSPDVDAGVSP